MNDERQSERPLGTSSSAYPVASSLQITRRSHAGIQDLGVQRTYSLTPPIDSCDPIDGNVRLKPREPSPPDGQSVYPDQFVFGRFRLLPAARTLLCAGRPVKIGSRAFDLLHLLLISRGRLVTKRRILAHVWPNTIVEESSVRVQVAGLRKALGQEHIHIKNIPGHGYFFAEDVNGSRDVPSEPRQNRIESPPAPAAREAPCNLYQERRAPPWAQQIIKRRL